MQMASGLDSKPASDHSSVDNHARFVRADEQTLRSPVESRLNWNALQTDPARPLVPYDHCIYMLYGAVMVHLHAHIAKSGTNCRS